VSGAYALSSQLRELIRRWRRYRHQAGRRTAVDLNQLERVILDHYYDEAARRLGLASRHLGAVFSVEGRGRVFRTFGVWTDFDTVPLGLLSGDKVVVREILAGCGLEIPEGAAFPAGASGRAWEWAQARGRPTVTKPARGTSSGRGVTVGLRKQREFRRAFSFAGLFCPDVLVETFFEGENYRALVYKGRTLSVLWRDMPAVTADGRQDLRALIAGENARRIRTSRWSPGDPVLMPLPEGPAAARFLAGSPWSLESVPPAGTKVRLAATCNYAVGTSYEEVLSRVHPRVLEAAETAAGALGLTLAGVDIISPDPSGPVYAINEVNTTPGLESHYFVRNREEARDPIGIIFADLFGVEA
jgi:D-alanine-D-alanine ligase-like ATP-grasp enzyme